MRWSRPSGGSPSPAPRWPRAQAGTLKLLKIGAVIVRNSRRMRFHLSSACPDKALFMRAAERPDP